MNISAEVPSCVVFVLDATWRVVKRMWKKSQVLHDLPSISLDFSTIRSAGYGRVRREPKEIPNAVSTLEAIAACLDVLEEAADSRIEGLIPTMIRPLEEMVEQQLTFERLSKMTADCQ
jgi:DTW domain-containing protein YfiP